MGVRRPPPLSFLRRSHPLNILVGRLRRKWFPPPSVPLPSEEEDSFYFE